MENNKLFAIIRVRGEVNVNQEVADTMKMMRLFHKNYCILLFSNPASVGMINKIKDYVTFGEIDEPTLVALLGKRLRGAANSKITLKNVEEIAKSLIEGKKTMKDVEGAKTFFRLAPPKGGFERKGIKHHFAEGGALGYRKEEINKLIKRMI